MALQRYYCKLTDISYLFCQTGVRTDHPHNYKRDTRGRTNCKHVAQKRSACNIAMDHDIIIALRYNHLYHIIIVDSIDEVPRKRNRKLPERLESIKLGKKSLDGNDTLITTVLRC